MKKKYLFTLLLITQLIFANDSKINCDKTDTFFPYKAGIIAEKNSEVKAFAIYCNLALKGDYRSQNKLARYYFTGIPNELKPDKISAYVWSKLSISVIKSKKKEAFLKNIKNQLSESEILDAETLFKLIINTIPSGYRIDGQYKPLDLSDFLNQQQNQIKTGTRIKSKKSIRALNSINLP